MRFRSKLPGSLALLGLLVGQIAAVASCAACETGGCGACTPCCTDSAPAAPDVAHCPLCAPEPVAACCTSLPGEADETATPCTCQWEPRDDSPLATAPSVSIDLDGLGPQSVVEPVSAPPVTLVARAAAARDIPQRPVRILWGVWRN